MRPTPDGTELCAAHFTDEETGAGGGTVTLQGTGNRVGVGAGPLWPPGWPAPTPTSHGVPPGGVQ